MNIKLTKKLTAVILASMLAVTAMTGCANNDNENGGSSSSGMSSAASEVKKLESGLISKVHEAVKTEFGDKYIPSMEIPKESLEEIYGIDPAWVKESIAEGPMISAHVDVFIAIEAAEGKAEDVEKALNAYKEKLVNDTMQYPMNVPKIKSAMVKRVDDYVVFAILGDADRITDAPDEESGLKMAEEEIKRAADAVESILKK